MDVRLIIQQGSQQRRTFHMKGAEMVIGRHKQCGLKIPSGSVSRQHCRLTISQGIVHVEDLASANGTLVNGDPVHQSVLRPGDLLTVGPVTFKIDYALTPDAVRRILNSESTRPKPPPLVGKKKKGPVLDEEEEVPVTIEPEDSQAPIPMSDDMDMDDVPVRILDDVPVRIMDEPAILPEEPEKRTEEEPPKKKKKKSKPPPERTEVPSPDYSMLMEPEGGWHAPTGENLRDLLAKLEEEE